MIMLLFLLLPLVTNAGFFQKHKELYLNEEINPCDDFFEHVCSKVPKTENFWALLKDKMVQKLQPFYTERFLNFIGELKKYQSNENVSEIVGNHGNKTGTMAEYQLNKSSSKSPLPEADLLQSYSPILWTIAHWYCYPQYCTSKQNLDIQQMILNATIADRLMEKIQHIGDYEAFHEYLHHNDTAFNVLEGKMIDQFEKMKELLLREFEKTPWLKVGGERPEIIPRLKETWFKHLFRAIIPTDRYYDTDDLHECVGNATDAERNRYCVVQVILDRLDSFRANVFLMTEIYDTLKLGLREKRAYYGHNNEVKICPALFECIEEDLPQMLGSINLIILHELSHSAFRSSYEQTLILPVASECFQSHMNNVCGRYFDIANCPPGLATYTEDAPDWIANRVSLNILNKMNPKPSNDAYMDFFYTHAMTFCGGRGPELEDPHSAAKVRVNGIMRQMEEFAETFNCKSGDFMKMEEYQNNYLPLRYQCTAAAAIVKMAQTGVRTNKPVLRP